MAQPSLPDEPAVVLPNGKKLAVSHIDKGIDILSQWLPDDAETIQAHKQKIIQLMLKNETPKSESPLHHIGHHKSAAPTLILLADLNPLDLLTPCELAIGEVVVDLVFFALGLAGLHFQKNLNVTRALLKEMGDKVLNGFLSDIHTLAQAEGALAKAKASFPLLGGIYNAGGISAIIKAIDDQMSVWEWVKTGIIMAAQFVSWFATDGVAFIAEVSLSIMSAEGLIQDTIKATDVCK